MRLSWTADCRIICMVVGDRHIIIVPPQRQQILGLTKLRQNMTIFLRDPHWGRVTHICVGELTIIGSDNGLSPGRRQAIIWTNAGILLIWPHMKKFWWNCNQNWSIFIQENALENVVCEMASILSRPQCVNNMLLRWHHNERNGVSNHRCLDCLLSRLFTLKKTSGLRVTGRCDVAWLWVTGS